MDANTLLEVAVGRMTEGAHRHVGATQAAKRYPSEDS